MKIKISLLLAIASVLIYSNSFSQEKKTLSKEDYKKWEQLSSTVISPDGKWVSYSISLNEGNDTLFIVNPETDSVIKEAFASGLRFSPDSRWAAYRIGVSYKKQEEMQEKKQTLHYKMGLLDMVSGKKVVYKEISSFAFPEEGDHLVMKTYKPKESKAEGSDIVVMNLANMEMRTIGNVTEYSFNKKGDFLAYVTEPANDIGKGVEVFDLRDYSIKILASDTSSFSNLLWEKEGESLAFLHQLKNKDYKEDNHEVIAFRNVYKGFNKESFSPVTYPDFPEKMRINKSRLQWSEDQSAVFFGLKDWNMTEKALK